MKSIRSKIQTIMLSIVIVICLVLGIVTCFLNYNSTFGTVKLAMQDEVMVTAKRVHYEIKSIENISIDTGIMARLSDSATSKAQKQKLIQQKVQQYDLYGGDILDANGESILSKGNYADQDFFKEAIKGNVFVSDPIKNPSTGKYCVYIAAPLWENGLAHTKAVGVVYYMPKETFLNEIVSEISPGKNGYGFILDSSGLNIADKDSKLVNSENVITNSSSDTALEDLAGIEKNMIAGKTGIGEFTSEDTKEGCYLAYTTIPESNGWSLGMVAVKQDFMSGTMESAYVTIAIAVAAILISLILTMIFARRITKPIKDCSDRMLLLSQGDLQTEVPESTSKDETGILIQSMGTLVKELKESIGDVSYHLQKMGQGDFSENIEHEYQGDFEELKTSMQQISVKLSDVLSQIVESSNQVASGAEQVSSGAQALSQGTTEQASSIEELSATINEVAEQVRLNAQNAESASTLVEENGTEVNRSNEKMQQLMEAMSDINDKSGEIKKIIKSIEDIAFQTNILALNAAVEAARAGEAGKGFAVVADEVRNLAAKSAEAAKNTTGLIEASLTAIETGKKLADGTVESMDELVASQSGVIDMVEQIKNASQHQANSITQITMGIDQISSVIQNNSATAEESAAASEELSGQAVMQRQLVDQFTLK